MGDGSDDEHEGDKERREIQDEKEDTTQKDCDDASSSNPRVVIENDEPRPKIVEQQHKVDHKLDVGLGVVGDGGIGNRGDGGGGSSHNEKSNKDTFMTQSSVTTES